MRSHVTLARFVLSGSVVLAAVAVVNERFLGLQRTIRLMVLALALTVVLGIASAVGIAGDFVAFRTLVAKLSLDQTLLEGVLCFFLFAGSIDVEACTLGAEKWIVLTLAIGAAQIAAVLIGLGLWARSPCSSLAWASSRRPIRSPLAILGAIGLRPRLEAIINGESLFNDGVGVVLYTIALGTTQPTVMDVSSPAR